MGSNDRIIVCTYNTRTLRADELDNMKWHAVVLVLWGGGRGWLGEGGGGDSWVYEEGKTEENPNAKRVGTHS